MPHVKGHVESSQGNYPEKVGIIYISLTEPNTPDDIKKGFPILFLNNRGASLSHGQPVRFHPHHIECMDQTFIIAINVVDSEAHDEAERLEKANGMTSLKGLKTTKGSAQEIKEIWNQEDEYMKSSSYKKIYLDNGKRKEKLDDEKVIQWIIDNAVPFTDMRLKMVPWP